MSDVYWAPKDIFFIKEQVEWLLPYLPELRAGIYPAEPSSGYVDAPINKRQVASRASFERVCQIAAELDVRIKKCGIDGYLIEEHFGEGLSISEIARERWMTEYEISRRINRVINYISSGPNFPWEDTRNRRGKTYKEFTSKRYENAQCGR